MYSNEEIHIEIEKFLQLIGKRNKTIGDLYEHNASLRIIKQFGYVLYYGLLHNNLKEWHVIISIINYKIYENNKTISEILAA